MKFSYTLLSVLLPALVTSHASIIPREGIEESYGSGVIRIPHGCDKSDTVKVVLEFDQVLIDAKSSFGAGYVNGWKTEVITAPVAKKVERREEKKPEATAQTIGYIYYGNSLPYNLFADFPVSFKLPSISAIPKERNNTVYFKVSQFCENNQWINWTDPKNPKYPPATYKLLPKPNNTAPAVAAGAKSSSNVAYGSSALLIAGALFSLL